MKFIYKSNRTNTYAAALQRLQKDQQSHNSNPKDTNTTVISLFYPAEGQSDTTGRGVRRKLGAYLRRMKNLLDTGKPIIMYTTPQVAKKLLKIRDDPYLIIIDDYHSVDEIPNIKEHVKNFELNQYHMFPHPVTQPWTAGYNRPHNMKVYNAKAWVVRDGTSWNPFNSEFFLFADAGLLFYEDLPQPLTEWASSSRLQDALKIVPEDSIAISQVNRLKSGEHACWKAQSSIRDCHAFAAGCFFGRAKGMIRFADAYHREFDLMNANHWYIGREEFIISRVAVSNQGLIRSYEAWDNVQNLWDSTERWLVFGKALGKDAPIPLVDPFAEATPATWASRMMIPF